MVDLWRFCRAQAGIYSGRPLPCSGGPADQPAGLMEAFTLLDGMLQDGG
ncbi:hypothetical protein [Sphingomonas sp. SRS2]|nr:hypothetical protein [Sphingomonas sp. SRS2]